MQIEQDYESSNKEEKKGNNKVTVFIASSIAVLLVAIIAVIIIILSMKDNKLKVYVDGVAVNSSSDTFIFTEDGKVYVSIEDIAPLVKYSVHKGEYKVNVDDPDKMYVECANETASFFYNSDKISKVAPNSNDDYENIKISEPVIKTGDKLYVISDGFISGFNSLFYYDSVKNIITIQTLPYLVSAYSGSINNMEFTKLSENFNNQKSIISGLIVAAREDGKYGVITTNGTDVISPRYNQIQYVESLGEFIITNSSNKVGIAYNTGKIKINVIYDSIKIIDSTSGLYLVKKNNKYGVINSQENYIIYPEYDKIGIDSSTFPADNIKNQYILCGNIIPAKYNNKWRLFGINGNRLNDDEYDELGFVNTGFFKNKIINKCLIIGNTNTIIVAKYVDSESNNNSKKTIYGGIDIKGNEVIPINYSAIYSTTSSGVTSYWIYSNEKEYNAVDLINIIKLRMGYSQDEIESQDEQENQNGTETRTTNEENTIDTEDNVVTETTNTVETRTQPAEANNVIAEVNNTSNSININQNIITQNTDNSTVSNDVVFGE